MMKIRVEITPPRDYDCPGLTIWNIRSIDEFSNRFIRDSALVIGDSDKNRWDYLKDDIPDNFGVNIPISTFKKHSEHIATFDTDNPHDIICIICALSAIDAPEGSSAIHNIKVDTIDEDQDPLTPQPQEKEQEWDDLLHI